MNGRGVPLPNRRSWNPFSSAGEDDKWTDTIWFDAEFGEDKPLYQQSKCLRVRPFDFYLVAIRNKQEGIDEIYICSDGNGIGDDNLYKISVKMTYRHDIGNDNERSIKTQETTEDLRSVVPFVKVMHNIELFQHNLSVTTRYSFVATFTITREDKREKKKSDNSYEDVDLSTPRDYTDVVFVLKDRKFHMNRQFMSFISPVFSAMLNGDFAESSRTEITLADDPNEFNELLQVVLPEHKPVTDKNAQVLLKLADIYDISSVRNMCERLLCDEQFEERKLTEMIYLADRYRLQKLSDLCTSSLKSYETLQAIVESKYFKEISDEMKAKLLEEHFRLNKPPRFYS